ncbi:MAG: transposase [Ktedonobacterales bacterium]|jgi:putative transposase|nr:MAG: transposase [Ktedonobacterales bacterium]
MQLVEQHRIDRHDPRFAQIDAAAFASKNLYNAALYQMRQHYIKDHAVITYSDLDKLMQPSTEYRALPAKVAQWILKQVTLAWKSYLAACREWQVHPSKFLGHPKLPKYLDKQGRNLLTYTDQAISRVKLRQGVVDFSGLTIAVKTRHDLPAQVRIVPHATHYTVEVVYERAPVPADVDPTVIAGIDLGVNNLATITANQPGFVPLLVNGRPLKALNQWYNKRRADLQAKLPKDQFTSRQLEIVTDKRKRQIDHYLHVASRQIIAVLVRHRIGTLVIGKNDGWKQQVNLGKRTNQTFVFLPHARFIDMLTYKAQLVGITVIPTEESYTSKCSFLDNESIEHHDQYVGRRVKRGLFVSATGRKVNADVNGAYNMIAKVVPNAVFRNGRAGVVVHPVGLALRNREHVA